MKHASWVCFLIASVVLPRTNPAHAQQDRWSVEFGRPGVTRQLGLSRQIHHAVEFEGRLIRGGWFTSAGGVRVRSLIAYDDSVGSKVGTSPPIVSENRVDALTVFQQTLVAGGWHANTGGTHVSRLDTNDQWQIVGNALFADPPTGQASIHRLTEHNGTLIAAGNFSAVDTSPAIGVAARCAGREWGVPRGS